MSETQTTIHETQTTIHNVPTNIITGFLGAGKTTAIMNLLKNKPAHERWAVLVNEFGEIGVDGSLLQGQSDKQHVFIQEVPGGCMCCVAGVPMQVALNKLLKEAKPDRVLIEPTGLGHPKEILQVLSSAQYQDVLTIQKTITLVDARVLSDARYTSHDTFNQQIAIADIVVGNKQDLYQEGEHEALQRYIEQGSEQPQSVYFTQHGELSPDLLTGEISPFNDETQHGHHHHHHHDEKALASELPMPESGIIKAENKGEGFISMGWRFAADKVFNQQQLEELFAKLPVTRLKAVFMTENGMVGYNISEGRLEAMPLTNLAESRIEIISHDQLEDIEAQLLATLT